MVATIASALAPVGFVIVLGYVAGRHGSFGVPDRALLTRLVLTWLLPPLLLSGVLKTPRADLLDFRILLIFFVGLIAPYAAVLLICRFVLRYDTGTATLKACLVAFPDMVFMGIPILARLFGPASLYPILLANLTPSLIIIPLTTVLLQSGSDTAKGSGAKVFAETLLQALRQPQVWAPAIGAVLVLMKVPIPRVATESLDLIGGATTGLSLFVVGLIVSEEQVRITAAVTADVLLKNLGQPVVMLMTVRAFGVTGVLAREAILLAAIPSAVITAIFAEQYGVITSEASSTILGTRILAFATIPLVATLTEHL